MLAIFVVTTTVHLYASYNMKQSLRNASKPWILLSLLGFYVFSVEQIDILVVLGLIFSWLGDMFLILKGVKWFAVGGIMFMTSHIFFIISYATFVEFSKINVIFAVLLIDLFIASSSIVFKYLRPHLPNSLFYPMYIYLVINGLMNCFAWFKSMSISALPSIITAIGALLFYLSDTALFFVRFDKNSKLKTHFLVMLLYSLGEFLIVLGIIYV